MSARRLPPEPLAAELAEGLTLVLQVLQSIPAISGGARTQTLEPTGTSLPHAVELTPQAQLGEMVGRTNIAYGQLERMFHFTPYETPVHQVRRPLDRWFSHADARRYVCALILMSRQLLPFRGPAFQGVPLSHLRRECVPLKVGDAHRNLPKNLRAKGGFVLLPQQDGFLVYLEPRAGQENLADLSDRAKSLCAEAVDQLAPFTATARVAPRQPA